MGMGIRIKMNIVSSENRNGNCYTEMGTYGNKKSIAAHLYTRHAHIATADNVD